MHEKIFKDKLQSELLLTSSFFIVCSQLFQTPEKALQQRAQCLAYMEVDLFSHKRPPPPTLPLSSKYIQRESKIAKKMQRQF